jgi:transposase
MGKVFRPYQPDQLLMLPPSMQEWLPADHAVHFVSDLVDSLDLSAILETYTEERGYPPYHPLMMTKLLLYGQVCGIRSSRKLDLAAREHVAFRVLCAGNEPDFRTIAEFRKRHLEALGGLFVQVVRLCQRTGLAKLGHIAIDGTKVRASANKHKAMSYQRMIEEEERLKREIRAMLEAGIAEDEAEDARHGRERRGDELPVELAFRESRLKKIQEAKAALEEEERARQKASSEDDDDRPPPVPKPKAQRNFTDPESRIMLDSDKAFVQAYNAQIAVDADSQVILAADVVQETNDRRQLVPMVRKVADNAGSRPERVSADAGYWSDAAVGQVEAEGSTAYVAPKKIGHREWRELAPADGSERTEDSPRERMWHRLRTPGGRAEYDKRKISVEPAIGQLKTVQGCRQFLLRGAQKVKGEWLLACTGHNILKLLRAHRRQLAQTGSPAG